MSAMLTPEDVATVVKTLLPAILGFQNNVAERPEHLAIRVLDPASLPRVPILLFSQDIGDESEWEHDYGAIAMGNALMCLREKCDSATVMIERPFCLQPGDTPFVGGVYVQGLVVAVAGATEDYFHLMYSRWIAAGCRAISTHRLQTEIISADLDAIPG